MKELTNLVDAAVDKALDKSAIETAINQHVQKAVNVTVEQSLRSYGKGFKAIEEKIEESIVASVSQIDIQPHHKMISDMVMACIGESIQASLLDRINGAIKENLLPAPKTITMQEVVDPIINKWREEAGECPCDDTYDADAHYEYKESKYGVEFRIWKKHYISGYLSSSEKEDTPTVRFYVSKRTKKISIMYANGDNVHTYNFGTTVYREEMWLYQLYAAGTIITDIEDQPDLETEIIEGYY